jgi:hypothetical protein
LPDRQVTISVSLLGLQDASVAAQNFGSDLKNVGAAAATATAQAAPLGPAIDAAATGLTKTAATAKEAAPALNAVETAAKTLQTALDKLAATDGPRGMIKNAALAQVALADYQRQATAAGVSTADMGRISDSAGVQISGAADKVGIFKKAQMDLAAQGALTGSQLDALRNSGGTLSGMFTSMERTGSGLTKSIGQLGVGLGIGSIAFMGAEAAGRALIKMLSDAEEKELRLIDTEIKGKNAAELHAAAMRALGEGFIENSTSVQGLITNYQNLELAQGHAGEAAVKTALGLKAEQMDLMDYNLQMAIGVSRSAALEGQFTNQARAEADVAKKTTDLTNASLAFDVSNISSLKTQGQLHDAMWREAQAADALTEAEARATAERYKSNEMMHLEEGALRAMVVAAREMGEAIPEGARAAIDALDHLKTKNEDLLRTEAELVKKMGELPAAMQNSITAEHDMATAEQKVADAHDRLVPSIDKILASLRAETEAAKTSGDAVGKTAIAEDKAATALAAYAIANHLSLAQVMEMVTAQGGLVNALNTTEAELAKQILELGAHGGATDIAAERTKNLTQELKDQADALRISTLEWDKNTAAVKARNGEVYNSTTANWANAASMQKAANDAADLRTSLEAATEAQTGSATSTANGIQVAGKATIVTLALAAATAEQTAALVEALKAQNLYTDSLQHTLSIATGWSDYLANLKSAVDNGTTSILQYKLALANFLTMLETQFPTATGKAKAALEEMIGVVQRLMDTAVGPTFPVDNSYGGALNKQFNGPGKP